MSNQKLDELLDQLKSEIAQLDDTDANLLAKLRRIESELEQTISSVELQEPRDDLLSGLDQWITELETSHPNITAILNNISVTLGNLGI